MSMRALTGGRLAYVTVPIKGKYMREICHYETGKGIVRETVKADAGYMVYFPQGHALHIRTREQLEVHGFDETAEIINMEGMHDPKSPLGKLYLSQNEAARKQAFRDLENEVITVVERGAGKQQINLVEAKEAA